MSDMRSVFDIADKNLVYAIRNRMGHSKDASFYDKEGYVYFTLGIDNLDGHINGGMCLDDSKAKEFLDDIDKEFSSIKRGYAIWVRDEFNKNLEELLREKGLKPVREPGSACMAIREKIENAKVPSGYVLRVVENNKHVNDVRSILVDSFDKDEETVEALVNLRMIANPRCMCILLYDKITNQAVATASVVLYNGTAGIYYVGTKKEYRGQGLGSYVAQEATNIGLNAGAKICVLQASEAGEKIYEKLGYEKIGNYRSYRVTFE